MIQIEINRYTIQKLEECMEKFNAVNNGSCYHVIDYNDLINRILDDYLKGTTPEIDERNRVKEVIDKVKKDCNISEYTHLCVRVIPKTDDELVGQLRGAQANIIKEIERRLGNDNKLKGFDV